LPQDFEFAVYKFSDDSQLLLEKTAQSEQIEQAILSLKPEGRYTALYDAVFDAAEYLEKQKADRKAILLLTDGRNEGGQAQLEESLAIALKTRTPVFTVGVGRNVNQRVLRRIAEQSGASYTDLVSTTGQTLGQSIMQALSTTSPPLSPEAESPGNSSADVPKSRILWQLIVLSITCMIAGLLFWKAFQRSTAIPSRENAPECHAPAVPASQLESVDVARTMPVPLRAFTATPTVRIKLKQGSLLVLDGPGAGQIFVVQSAKPTLLGRGTQSEVSVQDPTVSMEHCRIVPAGVGYILTDLGSTNGTAVNGISVKEHVLRDRDVIQAGSTSFEFRLSEDSRI
jgi:hypothetical protein